MVTRAKKNVFLYLKTMPRSSTPKVKRAPNAWARACKQWNDETKTERYTIPRKGTPEYDAVRAIMAKYSSTAK